MSTTSVTLSNSDRVRATISLVLPEMMGSAQALWDHPRLPEVYPRFLRLMHGVIRASVPLMEAALDQTQRLATRDPVAAAMSAYFLKHIPEERGHDDWLLQDLQELGIDPTTATDVPPSPLVAELVGAQYYWMFHFHPVALLGYIAVVEGYPPQPDAVTELARRSGYSAQAFRTLAKHAHLDRRHSADLDTLLDSLPLRPEHENVITLSALRTVYLFGQLMQEIVH
ncbi:MAG TPA: iron-containing redox enzyme family protein [Chloroflexota bacterium]|jgi:hypothetical protein|nr:iron-containing redox enzyme family protein [Chloroflexota bacterium]